MAVARGPDAAEITKTALAALGGIERFVNSNDDVIIKPNICVDYHTPEYAATTNPTVVATLVTLCLGAGARRVRVMDTPFGGKPESAYAISGIAEAVGAAGGEMEVMSPVKFQKIAIPDGRDITSWEVYRDVLEADVLINVPIAKHHSLARLSLGAKNLLGVITKPNHIHRSLGQRVADLTSLVRPTLTVVDAVRILTAHGPTGGSLNDVQQTDTIIASHEGWVTDFYHVTLVEPARLRVDRVDVGNTETNISHITMDMYETAVLRARVLDSGGQALSGAFACQWTSDATGVVFDTNSEDNLVMISADGSGLATLDVDLGDFTHSITVQVYDASGLGGGGQ